MEHKHSVYDTDTHFTINEHTRGISLVSGELPTIVQNDHNSERFTFDIPRLIDGHDLTLCDDVKIHYINVDGSTKDSKTGVYDVDDLQVSGNDENVVELSWLVSNNATRFAGTLNFLIRFACTTNGVVNYAWHTTVFKSIPVSDGLNNGDGVVKAYADVLTQWEARLFGVGDTEEAIMLAVAEAQTEAITAHGEAVKASIPADYSAMSALAEHNRRNKAGAIVLDADGESIVVNDASNYPLMGLKLFGKSTQDGTPTPDAPVDIVSMENPVVSVYGKNLAHPVGNVRTVNGYTITPNDDGTVTISGSAIAAVDTVLDLALIVATSTYEMTLLKANVEYKLTCWKNGVVTETPGTKQILEDGTIKWGWTDVEPQDRNITKLYRQFIPKIGDTDVCGTYAIQIEAGEQATEYEPYVKQSISVLSADGIPGIPVSGGGNYTDADGQQWICDEVDLARGVYVQRVGERFFDGTETVLDIAVLDFCVRFGFVGTNPVAMPIDAGVLHGAFSHGKYSVRWDEDTPHAYASNTLIYMFMPTQLVGKTDVEIKTYLATQASNGTPVRVQYILREPIETPLSEAEINAFKTLHSNKSNTTIMNDAGAYMAVEYVADTKTYIDNKIAELMAK